MCARARARVPLTIGLTNVGRVAGPVRGVCVTLPTTKHQVVPASCSRSRTQSRAVLLLLLLPTTCGRGMAAVLLGLLAAAEMPLLPITPSANVTVAWALPNPKLPFTVGPNPGFVWEEVDSPASSRRQLQPPAPIAKQGLLLGDVRVRLHVTAELALQADVTAQVFWRRRDHNPNYKAVVVTDAAGAQVQSSVSALQAECGVVHFAHTGPGDYFLYYLPHHQTGGGAGVHFSWFNCSDPTHGRKCVLDDTAAEQQAPDACSIVDAAAAAVAVALENRPNCE